MTEVIAAIWAVLAVMVGLMVPLMLDIRSGNRRLEASLRAEIGSLRDRTGEKFDELRGELAAVKDELGAEIHALAVNQAEMNGQLIVLREFATSRQAA